MVIVDKRMSELVRHIRTTSLCPRILGAGETDIYTITIGALRERAAAGLDVDLAYFYSRCHIQQEHSMDIVIVCLTGRLFWSESNALSADQSVRSASAEKLINV
jgi:hypothetical protein